MVKLLWKQEVVPQKIKYKILFDVAISLLGKHTKESKAGTQHVLILLV
jgi:hypothetical protein